MSELDLISVATMRFIRSNHDACKKDFDWFVWNERKKAGFKEPEPHLPECRTDRPINGVFQTSPLLNYLKGRRETMQYRGGTQTEVLYDDNTKGG